MKFGNCRLCRQDKELAHSHVLPEFFYEPTYDSSHKFISVSSHPQQKTKPFQKGLREHLLCMGCEGQLNRYETYAASILRKTDQYIKHDGRVIEVPNFNYTYFKLFGLSLIWRCHVSTCHMFSAVKLGLHAEKIRKMLAAKDPGKPLDYCFFLVKIGGPKRANTVIIAPGQARFQDHIVYAFMAYGFEWFFIVSSHSHKLPEDYPFVGTKQELVILIDEWGDQKFLREMKQRMTKLIDKDIADSV